MLQQQRPSRPGYFASKLFWPLIWLGLYSLSATWLEAHYLAEDLTISTDYQAVASFFLGFLLVLRINTSYNKWWEARTLWGRLVNEVRNLAAYTASLAKVPEPSKRRMRALLLEFPPTLMSHLREVAGPVHQPTRISSEIQAELGTWKAAEWIDGWEWSRLALVGESFLQVCGGCERIRNSPLIPSYRSTVMICAAIYLAAAPLVLHCRAWTTPLVMLLGGLFLLIEFIASDVDEPFGVSPDDLPLERLCQTMADSVAQCLKD